MRPSMSSTDIVVDITERGRMFGEEAANPGMMRPWSAVAITNGRMVRVGTDAIQRYFNGPNGQRLSAHLLSVMAERSQNFQDRLGDMTEGSVNERLARLILRLADRLGIADARGTLIPIRLTRNELAGFLGCREETVTRSMSRWARAGMLLTQREGMVLAGEEQLMTEAHPKQHRPAG